MLIIISGSSGVGKNTVINTLLEKRDDLKLLKTCTTRRPRIGEAESPYCPYYFLSNKEFDKKNKNDEFAEVEEVHQTFRGMLKSSLDEIAQNDTHYIKDIGVLGQANLKRLLEDKALVLSIFLTAPKEVLIERLRGRGEMDIDLRMSRMEFEEAYKDNYDIVIENIVLEKTIKKIESAINKYKKIEQKQKNRLK